MGWNGLGSGGWIENTAQKPYVQCLRPALEAGLLIVAGNGNTRLENELPPIDYFAVGRFNDHARLARRYHSPYPDEPWGRNGDGHLRPDVLAPGLYLPVPWCEAKKTQSSLSYFQGTSGASSLVAGVCAHLLSLYPDLEPEQLRQALIQFGDRLPGYENPAPIINVAQTKNAIVSMEHLIAAGCVIEVKWSSKLRSHVKGCLYATLTF
jgi:serine protease AprX